MRKPHEVDCEHAHECFSKDGKWGLGAYDDPDSNAAGGTPWRECRCMTPKENKKVTRTLEAEIRNKKFDHSTTQTCTSTARTEVPAIATLDDVLATMEKFRPKDEWVLLTPEGQCLKGTHQQIILYMASRHPWMRDPVTAFDTRDDKEKPSAE